VNRSVVDRQGASFGAKTQRHQASGSQRLAVRSLAAAFRRWRRKRRDSVGVAAYHRAQAH